MSDTIKKESQALNTGSNNNLDKVLDPQNTEARIQKDQKESHQKQESREGEKIKVTQDDKAEPQTSNTMLSLQNKLQQIIAKIQTETNPNTLRLYLEKLDMFVANLKPEQKASIDSMIQTGVNTGEINQDADLRKISNQDNMEMKGIENPESYIDAEMNVLNDMLKTQSKDECLVEIVSDGLNASADFIADIVDQKESELGTEKNRGDDTSLSKQLAPLNQLIKDNISEPLKHKAISERLAHLNQLIKDNISEPLKHKAIDDFMKNNNIKLDHINDSENIQKSSDIPVSLKMQKLYSKIILTSESKEVSLSNDISQSTNMPEGGCQTQMSNNLVPYPTPPTSSSGNNLGDRSK